MSSKPHPSFVIGRRLDVVVATLDFVVCRGGKSRVLSWWTVS
jgi:hypothetical protein